MRKLSFLHKFNMYIYHIKSITYDIGNRALYERWKELGLWIIKH